MKTIYSILYVTLNASLNERVSMGLLMSNGEQHVFDFSSEKLLAIKGIINPNGYQLVKAYFKNISRSINNDSISNEHLFNNLSSKRNWISEGYISYLSKYSNNLIQFSEAKVIDIELNHSNFNKLFEKYIFNRGEEPLTEKRESVLKKVKRRLYPKIDTRVNLDQPLDSSHFENLFTPLEVNFIGINGVTVTGQTLDFEKKHYNLENDIARFVSLTKAIELKERRRGQYYVIGREPTIGDKKNHGLWEQIRDAEFLEFVDVDDVGLVEEYMVRNDVKPYFAQE